MAADRRFDAYSKQVCLIAEWMSLTRGPKGITDGETELKAVCQSAIVSLENDLRAISEIEECLTANGRLVDDFLAFDSPKAAPCLQSDSI